MCGIFAFLRRIDHQLHDEELRRRQQKWRLEQAKLGFRRIRHRGPDQTRITDFGSSSNPNAFLGFHRLAIIDPTEAGMQPIVGKDLYLLCNGEIYNHRELEKKYSIETRSKSDCEVIAHLYDLFGRGSSAVAQICQILDAEFCFFIYDTRTEILHVARDFGIRPLFYLITDDCLALASEAKALMPITLPGETIQPFPPNTYWSSDNPSWFIPYYALPLRPVSKPIEYWRSEINRTLTKSVKDRLVADRPLGFFLSGGLDSSLVVSIASRLLGGTNEDSTGQQMVDQIQTFSIGLEGSPDILAARKVSSFLSTKHHEVIFTVEEALASIEEIIRSSETFDTTTIRASTPQYLLSKWISNNTEIRVLLSGEGSDELGYGYLMWHQAPSLEEAQVASKDLCNNLYLYDCLRVDRTTACWGLEVRVPFLSREMIDLFHYISPEYKMPAPRHCHTSQIEKALIRSSFEGYLPEEILWRTKAAFSDAVGHGWVDALKAMVEQKISDQEFETERELFEHCQPRTKEELYYRRIFEKYYPGQKLIPDFWRQRWSADHDPSARSLACYKL
jgi:asparagine synthase (glutamine-hydrolysing)